MEPTRARRTICSSSPPRCSPNGAARGLKLNVSEAVALISAAIMEGAPDGRSVAALMSDGKSVLTRADMMDGVAAMILDMQVEATSPDGTKLVIAHQRIA